MDAPSLSFSFLTQWAVTYHNGRLGLYLVSSNCPHRNLSNVAFVERKRPRPQTEMGEEEFKLLSTLRYDPHERGSDYERFYMLERHQQRLLRAASHFGWKRVTQSLKGAEGLRRLYTYLHENIEDKSVSQRISLRVSQEASFEASVQPTSPCPESQLFPSTLDALPSEDQLWTLYIDNAPTHPSSFTRFKSTRRQVYDAAKSRSGLAKVSMAEPLEVLLFNHKGEVTEGGRTSVYLRRPGDDGDGGWVSPLVECGGHDSTTHEYALQAGLAVEGTVSMESVQPGEKVVLSNGVRGFVYAVVKQGIHPS